MTSLLLEPHADDAVLFSCWNLLRYRPKVITVLRSDRMADPRYPGGQVSHEERLAESEAAFGLLGIEWEQWEFSDVDPDWDGIFERVHECWLETDLLIVPACEDGGHPHHNELGCGVEALTYDIDVIHYMTYTRGGGRSTGGREVPFEPDWPILKLRALACYESQIRHPATAPHFVEGLREWVA